MYETLFTMGLVFAILAGLLLAAAIVMFFVFNVPEISKDVKGGGMLKQKQIEEIRNKNSAASANRMKVNVFEELEKKAKVKKTNTGSLNLGTTTGTISKRNVASSESGTVVLSNNAKSVNSEFVIEKNIMFVSSNDIL